MVSIYYCCVDMLYMEGANEQSTIVGSVTIWTVID